MSELLIFLLPALLIFHVAANNYTQEAAENLYLKLRAANTTDDFRQIYRDPQISVHCEVRMRHLTGEDFENFLYKQYAEKERMAGLGFVETGYRIYKFKRTVNENGFVFRVAVDYFRPLNNGTLTIEKSYIASKKEDGLKIRMSSSVCENGL